MNLGSDLDPAKPLIAYAVQGRMRFTPTSIAYDHRLTLHALSWCQVIAWRMGLFWIAVCVVAGGCSSTRLAYENADWAITRYIDGYLDLSDRQKETLREDLRELLDAYRKREIPMLVRYLDGVRAMTAKGLSASDVDCTIATGRFMYEVIATPVASIAADLLVSLTPAQINELEKVMNKANQRYRKNHLQPSEEKRLADKVDRVSTHLEQWIGPISARQLQIINRETRKFPNMAREWLEFKEMRESGLLTLMRRGADSHRIEAYLLEGWVTRERLDDVLGGRVDEGLVATRNLIVAVDATLDTEQRRHATHEIEQWLGRVQELELSPTPYALPAAARNYIPGNTLSGAQSCPLLLSAPAG